MKTSTYYDASTNKWKKIVIDDGNPNTISTSEITASDMKDLRKETDLNLYNGDNLSEVISKIYARVRNEEENGDIIGDEIGDYKSEPLFVSDNYSMSSDDHGKLVVCQNLQSNINLSLPADKKAGWVLTIVNRSGTQKESVNVIGKNKDASPNIIRYNAAGIATSSITLARNQKVTLISDGEFWYEISGSFAISSDIATNAVNDADGNNIIDTYLKQQEAADTYLRQDSTDYIKSISYDDHEISIGYANEEKDYTINTIKKADKLSTPRNINGVSFDGSSDITITEMPNGAAVTGTLSVSGDNAAAEINGDINISKSGAKINFAEDSYIDANNYTGTSAKAEKDASGNIIADTYLNKNSGGTVNGNIDTTGNISVGADFSVIGSTTLGGVTNANEVSAASINSSIITATDHITVSTGTEPNTGVNIEPNGIITSYNSSNGTSGTIIGDRFIGTSDRATMDGDGNNITSTYVKKEEYDETISGLTEGKVDSSGDEMTGDLTMTGGSKIRFVGNEEEPTEAYIDSTKYTGTASYAEKDSADNIISDTYARKDGTEFTGNVTFAEGTTTTVNGDLNTKNINTDGEVSASSIGADSVTADNITVNDTANITNKLTAGSLNVTGSATVGSTVDISGKLTVTNDIQAQNINSSANISGETITVNGDIQSINGKVIANNGIKSAGTIKAGTVETDTATVKGSITADSVDTNSAEIDSASIITANVDNLSVSENSTFTGSISSNGITNTGDVTTDTLTVNQSMNSVGPATFDDSITANSLTVNTDASINGSANIGTANITDLSVTGNTTVGAVTAGDINASSVTSSGKISGTSIETDGSISGVSVHITGDGIVDGRLNVKELDAETMIINHEQLGDLTAEKVITKGLEVSEGTTTNGITNTGDITTDNLTVNTDTKLHGTSSIDDLTVNNKLVSEASAVINTTAGGTITVGTDGRIEFKDSDEDAAPGYISKTYFSGNSESANKDGEGNIIRDTYLHRNGLELQTVASDVMFNGDITINGSGKDATSALTVNKKLNVVNNTTTDTLTVNNNTDLNGELSVDGRSSFNNDVSIENQHNLTVDGMLTVNQDSDFNGAVNIQNNQPLNVNGGRTTLSGGLTVTGGSTVSITTTSFSVNSSKSDFTGDMHTTGDLKVDGQAHVGSIIVDSAFDTHHDFTVQDGDIKLVGTDGSKIKLNHTNNSIEFLNPTETSVEGSLTKNNYTGTAKYAEQDVNGNSITTTYFNKDTEEAQTIASDVTFNKSVAIGNNIDITGEASVLGEGGLNVTAAVVAGSVHSNGSIGSDGTLTVGGETTLKNAATIENGGLTVTSGDINAVSGTVSANKISANTVSSEGDVSVSEGSIIITNTASPKTSITISHGSITFNNDTITSFINAETYDGKAAKATADKDGNEITSTYATKTELSNTESSINENITTKYEELDNNKVNNTGDTITGELSLEAALKLLHNESGKSTSIYEDENGLNINSDHVKIGPDTGVVITSTGITIGDSETPTLTATEYSGNANSANRVNNSLTIKYRDSVEGADKEASFDGSSPVTVEFNSNALTDSDKVVKTDDELIIDGGDAYLGNNA